MRRPRILGVIPARIGSERLPRKPLHPLAGRPLIEWVWRRVRGFSILDEVVIATDSEEVAEVCRAFGAVVALTSAEHASGTDRVAEVAGLPAYRDYEVVVNIQGDEPFISEEQVESAARLVLEGWDVGTVAAVIETASELQNPAVVKVVRRDDGGALYFSRSPIPHLRDRVPTPEDFGSDTFLRHVGVYAYSRAALARWVALPPGLLERMERLEQLRALAAGLGIGVALVEAIDGGVDTYDDARRAEERLLAAAN